MSGLDLIARGRLAQQDLRTRRLSTLYALRSAIGRANFRRAPLAASSPAISEPNAAATLTAAGYTEYNPATAGALNANYGLYTFLGGSWTVAGPLSPLNLGVATTGTVHNGNGSDPSANAKNASGTIRFMTTSPLFELIMGTGGDKNYWRMKVDGEYIATPIGDDISQSRRWFTVQFGDGGANYRQLRRIELEAGIGSNAFMGIRCLPLDRPSSWPDPVGLRGCLHGDSLVDTIADSVTDCDTLSRAPYPAASLREALGVPNIWGSGVGSTGFVASGSGTKSTFGQRLAMDILPYNFDFIVETGGLNDQSLALGSAVTDWLNAVISANPAVVIFMFAPTLLAATSAPYTAVAAAKQAAAANFPKNVAFIDNLAEAYVAGTGRVGSTKGDGNADIVRGTDNTHWSAAGAADHFGPLWARGVAGGVQALIAANM